MSFSLPFHPSPKGPAPVRVECVVRQDKDRSKPDLWEVDIKVTVGAEGWREEASSLTASTEGDARAQAYIKVIQILGEWLADLYTKQNPTWQDR